MAPALLPELPVPAPASTETDVSQAASGDLQAFERLYRDHVARVHGLARRMAGSDWADELTQDVFVRAWQKLRSFRAEASFATWLHRVAVNVIIERLRRATVERARRVDDFEPAYATARSRTASPAVRMGLDAALETLPPGARAVFVLYDVEGYTHPEIGAMLGISVGTSKTQLHRARRLLRAELARDRET